MSVSGVVVSVSGVFVSVDGVCRETFKWVWSQQLSRLLNKQRNDKNNNSKKKKKKKNKKHKKKKKKTKKRKKRQAFVNRMGWRVQSVNGMVPNF